MRLPATSYAPRERLMNLDHKDRLVLEEIQRDFPLVLRPFAAMADRCGLTENDTIDRIKKLVASGVIRDVRAILDAERIGYKSTLVAVKAERDRIDTLASSINLHPGVSHNYLRNHEYNMWFTLALREDKEFESEIEKLIGKPQADYLLLPALRKFKVRVEFQLSGRSDAEHQGRFHELAQQKAKSKRPAIRNCSKAPLEPLDDIDRKLLVLLQDRMEIVPELWSRAGQLLELSAEELFKRIRDLKDRGTIRRISGVLRHRRIGYAANGMACFRVEENAIEQAGIRAAEFAEVSHCYQRKTYPEWPYSLFAMVHGKSREETESVVQRIANAIDCSDYITLYSYKELKKERVRYFEEKD